MFGLCLPDPTLDKCKTPILWYDTFMPIRKKSASNKRVAASQIIGRERFAKISAVEGIEPSSAMKKRVAQFDRAGLSAAERRREIIKAHKKS
jgi:hypothetical protein